MQLVGWDVMMLIEHINIFGYRLDNTTGDDKQPALE